jgi:hypothetical protein
LLSFHSGSSIKSPARDGLSIGEKYSDGRGLCLLAKKANKYWRMH